MDVVFKQVGRDKMLEDAQEQLCVNSLAFVGCIVNFVGNKSEKFC